MAESTEVKPIVVGDLDPTFRDEIASLPGGENISSCFACGTCSAGCPVTNIDEEYNCRRLIRQIAFGMRDEVLKSPVIWLCILCYRCYARCPQEVNFTDVMKALRHLAVRDGHAPANMLTDTEEIDRLSQLVRRDMVKNTEEGRKQVMQELKAKLSQE